MERSAVTSNRRAVGYGDEHRIVGSYIEASLQMNRLLLQLILPDLKCTNAVID